MALTQQQIDHGIQIKSRITQITKDILREKEKGDVAQDWSNNVVNYGFIKERLLELTNELSSIAMYCAPPYQEIICFLMDNIMDTVTSLYAKQPDLMSIGFSLPRICVGANQIMIDPSKKGLAIIGELVAKYQGITARIRGEYR